MDDGGLGVVYL
uniref:Uncharacterized protein n=1 Tax=Rhizophora mucronata TaxID=61149 RepID=A0A2P2NCS5_RHIMU